MARKVDTDEERLRRILLVRDYTLEQINNNLPVSTRSISNYFTEHADNANYFAISNNTVSDYIERLQKIDSESYKKIKAVLNKNKPKTIEDNEVINRIKKVVQLLLEDYTVEEIAAILEESPNTINKDINLRLTKISLDKEILKQVKEKLSEHSRKNLLNSSVNKKL